MRTRQPYRNKDTNEGRRWREGGGGRDGGRGQRQTEGQTVTGVVEHTVARVVAGWTVFLLGRLPGLFHPGKDLLGQGWVGGQWGGGRRGCRGGGIGWLSWGRFRGRGGPVAAPWLLSPRITTRVGTWGQWRGHLGAGVVLRWQTGPHAAAIQLLGLG